MLALSTACAAGDLTLDAAVSSFKDLGVNAVALHRAPTAAEAQALVPLARRVRIVAVFADAPGPDIGAPLLVVEGGPADEDREASLDRLCRRFHALRRFKIGLCTPPDEDHHPSPDEIEKIHDMLKHVGYWHDAARGGEEYLTVAERFLLGASFDPLEADVQGLADAMPTFAPAVIVCEPERVREAIRLARVHFRA
ncbi:MAG TPA: hypothetical protein VFY93_09065 [Planctomycetota bacterium]|nr:hypothetical protein [Planctomycetota bacterium]